MHPHIFTIKPQKDYELLDSGDGMKLERYGNVVMARPDPQALWRKRLSPTEWKKADAHFAREKTDKESGEEKGKWVVTRSDLKGEKPSWNISFGDLTMHIKLSPFKHTGLFPEQLNNWLWCRELIQRQVKENQASGSSEVRDKKPKVLNLFGYTGGASLSAALGGAEVTHVDASKGAVTWANENAKLSGLEEAPIRWILEDAFSFVKREIRRGSKYDAIIMDPPSYGRGAKGEIWKIEESFLPLLEACFELLSDKPLFMVLNGYAAGYSPIAYENNLQALIKKYGGSVESGELAVEESSGRLLPCGMVSRWKRDF